MPNLMNEFQFQIMAKKEIEVDLWKTGAHKVEIGIKKQEEYRAKSRQFTVDTDIIGNISLDVEGYIAIRQNAWSAPENEQKLVVKYFTKSMNWKASIEELVALGLSRTLASDKPLPIFSININRLDHLVTLEKIYKPKSFNKAVFSFIFITDGKLDAYRIEADRLTLGSDWTVINQYNQKVAIIDGSKFNIGGKWTIKIEEKYKVPPAFDEVLIVFCGILRYLDDIEERLTKIAKNIEKKKIEIPIGQAEFILYKNPRRLEY